MPTTLEELKHIILKHNPSYSTCLDRFKFIYIEYLENNPKYNTWSARCLVVEADNFKQDILLHIRPVGNLLRFDYESLQQGGIL